MNAQAAAGSSVSSKGLKGVIAADSSICFIDGEKGILVYRGYNIHELAEHSTFEEVAYLLFKGELPNRQELAEFTATLSRHRTIPRPVLDFLRSLPKDVLPMAAL